MSDRERKRGFHPFQAVTDLLAQLGSFALFAFALFGFLAGALAGISLLSRLGGAGWIMYAVVIGTWALLFGPVIASAVTLSQKGNPRHRAAVHERAEQQRRKYGLASREAEHEEREAARARQRRRPPTA